MTTKQLLLSKGALSAIVAAVSAKLGVLFYVLVLLSVLMIVDFMAGMAASRKESLDHPGDKKGGIT